MEVVVIGEKGTKEDGLGLGGEDLEVWNIYEIHTPFTSLSPFVPKL